MLSFMGIFDLIGTTLSGWLSDRFDNRWLLFWYYSNPIQSVKYRKDD